MTAQVMPQNNASEVSENEAKRELRTSLTLAISEFHGESVRPRLVKNNRNECKMSPATTPTSTNMTTPTKDNTFMDNGVDLEALQALVAALSFSPIRDGSSPTTASSSNKQKFSFDSPAKQSNNSNLTTPWVKRGQAATPPTATLQQDDDEEEKEGQEQAVLTNFNSVNDNNDKENRPSIMEQKQQQETAKTHTKKNDHPVRKFRVPSSAEAVASAYPLSLPKEIMQPKTVNDNTTAPLSQKSRNILHSTTTNNNKNNSKPVKRYPTVSTDIPGAGTLRSSMSYRKSTPKLPFVPIVNTNGTLARRGHKNHTSNVAQHVYHHAKGVWAWGKGIMVVSPLMGMAEGVVSVAAGITTGNGSLRDVEQNVVSPLVVALDEHVLNPALETVADILSGILGGGGARSEQK